MCYYYELWGEECSICLRTDNDFYFINECNCTHLICLTCISKINKCPFCRHLFSSDILMLTDVYRIHDLNYPYSTRLVTADQYWHLTATNFDELSLVTYELQEMYTNIIDAELVNMYNNLR